MINIQDYGLTNRNFNNSRNVGFQATLSKAVKKDLLTKYGFAPETIQNYVGKLKNNPNNFVIENIDTYGSKYFYVRINENNKITLIGNQFKYITDVLEYMIKYKTPLYMTK